MEAPRGDDLRNSEAADVLDRFAEEVSRLEGSEIHQRLLQLYALAQDVGGDFWADFEPVVSLELRRIGFHSTCESGAEFLAWYRDNLEGTLREHIEGDESTIPAPDLEAEVENDPAVRAASQQYEEARAKARAQARKTL
jgi:hypothetical protein